MRSTILKSSLFLCFVLTGITASAQIIDSLRAVLPSKKGLERLDVMLDLSYEYIDIDNQAAYHYALQVYPQARHQRDTARLIRAGRFLATSLRRLGKNDSASLVYQEMKAVAEAKRDTSELISILNSHGLVLGHQSRYDAALKSHFQSLVLAEKVSDSSSIAHNLNNVGFVYYKLKDYSKAIIYFKRCLNLDILKRKIEFQRQLNLNIGVSYAYLKNYELALAHVNAVVKECAGDCAGFTRIMADFNLGVIHFGLNEFDEAERFFLQSYRRATQNNEVRFRLDNLIYLAQIAIHQHLPAKAITLLTRSERLIDEGTELNLEKIKIYNQFFRAYRLLNDFRNTALYQQKYIDLKESVYDESLTNSLMKVEAEYLEKENLAKIQAQAEVLALRQEAIDRQRWINVLAGLVIVSLFVTLVNLFQRNKHRRFVNDRLELKVRERTKELEAKQIELVRACRERDLIIGRTAVEISESLATLNGLYTVGSRDHELNNHWLLGGVEKISGALDTTLAALKFAQKEESHV